MEAWNSFEKPVALQEGRHYFLRVSQKEKGIPVMTQVTFLGHTACPAVVIVQDARKEWLRCNREDLFSINMSGKILTPPTP